MACACTVWTAVLFILAPVVQSIISLTKPLVEDLLSCTGLTKPNVAIFFCRKIVRSFCNAKAPHIFFGKNGSAFM